MKQHQTHIRKLAVAAALGAAVFLQPLALLAADGDTQPLKLTLPMPTLKGTPEDLPKGPGIEPITDKPPGAFEDAAGKTKLLVPIGVKNVAPGVTNVVAGVTNVVRTKVTSSVPPFTGELSQITDWSKEAFDDHAVEFKKGTQWVQVDLGQPYKVYAVAVWHDHRYIQLFRSVIVQVSNDPDFKADVTTLYNNDTDNSSGLGIGTDKQYFETRYGRVIDGKGAVGRYVRSYTKGSSQSAINVHQELEVFGLPAK